MLKRWSATGLHRAGGPRPNLSRHPARALHRRERGGRTRRILRALLWTVAASLGAWTAAQIHGGAGPLLAGWFEIRDVRMTGLRAVTQEEVLDRLQLEARATLLSVSPPQLEARVSAHPWIKSASVSRLPLHALSVEITERHPAAVLKAPSASFLLDDEGTVLTALAEREHEDLPVMVGVDPKRLLEGDARLRQVAQSGIRLAGLLTQSLAGRPEIDVSDPDHVMAYIQGMRFRFGTAPLDEQWDRYRAVEPVRRTGAGKEQPDIDLRFPGKVIVREQGEVKL
jgi:hypothetical protein